MTEFTKDIQTLTQQASAAPQLQTNTGSLATDVISAASFGLDLYRKNKAQGELATAQKAKASQATRVAEGARDYGNLVGGLKNQKAGGVATRARITDFFKDFSAEEQISIQRTSQGLGQSGVDVVRTEREREEKEISNQAIEVSGQFDMMVNQFPDLQALVERDSSGVPLDSDKPRVIELGVERIEGVTRANKQRQKAEVLLQGSIDKQRQGVGELTESINNGINASLNAVTQSYITFVNSNSLVDTDGVTALAEVNSNLQNVVALVENQVTSQFASATAGIINADTLKLAKEKEEMLLNRFSVIKNNLNLDSLDKAKSIANQLKLIENQTKLTGLDAFSLVATLESLAPNTGSIMMKAVLAGQGGVMSQLKGETMKGIASMMNDKDNLLNFTTAIGKYHEDGNPSNVDKSVLSGYYNYAKEVINSPTALDDMSTEQVDRVSGGLVGILFEASTTDNPQDIRNAVKLLNTDNFNSFMGKLPQDKKEQLGRYVQRFNEEVLVDPTDGIFKELDRATGSIDVTYDADAGVFSLGEPDADTAPDLSTLRGSRSTRGNAGSQSKGPDIGQRRYQVVVDKANASLQRVRDMSEYDPTFSGNARGNVDFLIGRYLPATVKVKGTLEEYTPKVQPPTKEQEELVTSKEQILKLQEEVTRLTASLSK